MTLTMAHSSEPLAASLNERIGHLHQAIRSREGDGATALATFIERYVALVPEFIEVFEDFLASAGISGEIKRQIVTAQEFLQGTIRLRSHSVGWTRRQPLSPMTRTRLRSRLLTRRACQMRGWFCSRMSKMTLLCFTLTIAVPKLRS